MPRSSPFEQTVVAVRSSPELSALLRREVVERGVAETASVAWARFSEAGWRVALDEDASDDGTAPVFDLASVTKPLTAAVALQLVARGSLALSDRVGAHLRELADAPASDVTIEELLCHRGGLPAWGALYRREPWASPSPASLPFDEPVDLERMLARAASRVDPTRGHAVYSDIGYVLLGEILARVLGGSLAAAWSDTTGIGNARIARARRVGFDARVAPTERSAWRGEVRGVVHDENAFALELAGGSPGHAGAFATAAQVCAFAIAFADAVAGRPSRFSSAIARAAIAPRPNGSHLLGWDGRSGDAPSSGRRFGPRTFGHLGFTGTSVWIDPDADVVAVLLTNRTWPSRDNLAIRAARPRVHDALFDVEP